MPGMCANAKIESDVKKVFFDDRQNTIPNTMGGFHRAGTGKNKKVIEISTSVSILTWSENLKNHIFGRKLFFQILFLFLVPKILKNCL